MDQVIDSLRATSDPSRMRILCLLEAGELTVSELVTILSQSQPRVSRHLKILLDSGLLSRFREGSWVFHRLNPLGLARQLVGFVPKNDPILRQDLSRLNDIEKNRTRIAEQYFAKYAPEWDRLRQLDVDEDQVANAVRAVLPLNKSQNLLDLGTGTGRMLQVLGPDVGEALGVDVSCEMLAVARSNIKKWGLGNCQLRQGDILALPVDVGQFDAVVLHQVLHFLERPWVAIAESLRMLKKQGCLLIVDLAPHQMDDLRDQHAHRRLGFSDGDVREWVADQGFSCETIQHLSGSNRPGGLNVTIWLVKANAPLILI